jgi:16S rRNA (guanine527-N7)-methyltransferase
MHEILAVFDEALTAALARWGLSIEPDRLGQLRTHYEAVVEANRTMNLTRITDPVEAAVKHYADSLALLLWVEKPKVTVQTLLDVGTGAGFPAVPLVVMRPDWSVTAIDATRKKIDFLRRTADAIGLSNLHCEHAHSEHWKPSAVSQQFSAISRRSSGPGFDLVVFRALTSLAKSLEQTSGYVAEGGCLVAYKTASMDPAEQRAADRAAAKLHLRLDERFTYDLELEGEKLNHVLFIYCKSGKAGP